MFKGYILLERLGDSVKLRHTITGDISWRHKAICSNCNKDRGWKKKHQLQGKCNACSQHKKFIDTMVHVSPSNVDLTKCIAHIKPNKGSETRYLTSCLTCSKNRGYLPLSSAKKQCRSCTRKSFHENLSKQDKEKLAKKISMTQSGEAEFTGFKTSESDKERVKFKSRELSKACFERDAYKCQKCDEVGGTLNAHHMDGFDKFPDLRFNLDNLITLCKSCHKDFHEIYGLGNNTREQWVEFRKDMIKYISAS